MSGEATTATVDYSGASRQPAPDGFTIAINWTAVPRRWRALIATDDGATVELYGPDYDRLVAESRRFVAALIAHRAVEMAGAA